MERREGIDAQRGSRGAVYALFSLVTIGAALGNLSQTGLNAMLPSVMAELGVAVDVGQWLTTGYMLTLGIAVPVATYLMRRLDDRRFLLAGFGLFALGSLVDYLAPEFFSMLLGRVMQAAAVGVLIPKMQTTAMTKFPHGKQATAMGVAGIALGFAPNIGPTVGGGLDSAFGWRSFFLMMMVVAAILFALTLLLVKRSGSGDATAQFETVSFILSTIGFGGMLLGLSQASSYGLRSAWVWAPVAVGVVFTVLFIRRQRAVEQPLMDLRIFASRVYNAGLVASVFLFACYMGATLVIPLYAQGVRGATSFESGLIMFPAVFTAIIVNPLSGVLADKTSPRFASLIFGFFLAVGSVLCVLVGEDAPLWQLTVFQTIRATGVSGLIGPLLTYSLSGLAGPLIPHGSAASVLIRQLAATFGTAIMVFFVAALSPLADAGAIGAAVPYQASFAFSAVMGLASLGVVVFRVK